MSAKDYNRFTALLYIMNQPEQFRMDDFLHKNNNVLQNIFREERSQTLVSILGYCLIPNHFHLILYEKTEGGISKFMSKLLTAYSMYFNTKYERSGSLFTHPFKSEHINNEPQFMYIFSYVHLNPVSIIDKKWKENGIKSKKEAEDFLENYQFSSYIDFKKESRPESKIIDFSRIPKYIRNMNLDLETQQKLHLERRVEIT